MDQLKEYAERLNNLYFKLNGLYTGVVENLKKNNVSSQEVDFLVGNLDPNYIGTFLEELDDYIIDVINHGLNVDFGYFIELKTNLDNCDVQELYSRVNDVAGLMSREINDVESKIYSIDSNIPGLGVCCEEMRSVLEQIDESLFHIARITKDVVVNEEKQEIGEPENI